MNKYAKSLLTLLIASGGAGIAFLSGCQEVEQPAVPIAPILKDTAFPSVDDVVPGGTATISGLGFSDEDIVYLKDASGKTIQVEVVGVTDYDITIAIPEDAGGEYTVIIERAGLQTTLEGTLSVPLMVVLEDVQMPADPVSGGSTATILGSGFEAGDKLEISGSQYPTGKTFSVDLSIVEGGVEFTVPAELYGVSTVIITRGERRTNLGTISTTVNVGDAVGGGIVYYVTDGGIHGYIVNMSNIGSATEKFGPEVTEADAAGTSTEMGTGKTNTESIINKFNALQSANNWPEWVGVTIAAQWCADHTVADGEYVYDDWYLPSQAELSEVFKVKNMLAEKGVSIPANNYWTSSEAPSPDPGWAAYYVNFYEAENLVTAICSKAGWTIGVLPIRSF